MDTAVANFMLNHQYEIFTKISNLAMWLGSTLSGMLICGFSVVLIFAVKRNFFGILIWVSLTFASLVTSLVLKDIIQRDRPPYPYSKVNALGYSMPSSAAAVCVAGLVALWMVRPSKTLLRRMFSTSLFMTIIVVCFSLIYLGAHWFTDVVAGALVGATFGTLAIYIDKRRRMRIIDEN